MSLEHVFDRAGAPAVLDDMPEGVRAVAVIIEHANRRKDSGLLPIACPCDECRALRACLVCERTENPGELSIRWAPREVAP